MNQPATIVLLGLVHDLDLDIEVLFQIDAQRGHGLRHLGDALIGNGLHVGIRGATRARSQREAQGCGGKGFGECCGNYIVFP